jgi:hypothetical protein
LVRRSNSNTSRAIVEMSETMALICRQTRELRRILSLTATGPGIWRGSSENRSLISRRKCWMTPVMKWSRRRRLLHQSPGSGPDLLHGYQQQPLLERQLYPIPCLNPRRLLQGIQPCGQLLLRRL